MVSAFANRIILAVYFVFLAVIQCIWLHYNIGFPLGLSAVDAFVSFTLLHIIVVFYSKLIHFLPKNFKALIIIAECALLAYAWVYVFKWIMLYFFDESNAYSEFWNNTIYIRAFVGWVLLSSLCFINFLNDKIRKDKVELELAKSNEKMRNEAELYKLRQQLHPHFLFNSLNSINALIISKPTQSREMLGQLSDFLRHTLKKEDKDLIVFEDEMKDLELYLSIEQVRFGDRLIIEKNINTTCLHHKIPPFLLQPLVENAIKFGLYGMIGKVTIHIDSDCYKDNEGNAYITFSISNPYDEAAVAPKGTGFGIEGIRRRLYLIYTRNDLLKIQKNYNQENDTSIKQFKATITIPIIDINSQA